MRQYAVLLLATGLACGADFDLLIRNARVVDGTGNAWFRADVGVQADRIVAIGRLDGKTAGRVVEARGRVLAPGFIDVHVHADSRPERSLVRQPEASSFLFDGVTTIVNGNCGWSDVDLSKLFAEVERTRAGVNMASMVGHGSVRLAVMGAENRAPTPAELQKMRDIVRRAMEDGAVGFSTGLWYVPNGYAKTEEVIALAREAAAFGGVYATHMRDEGPFILESVKEAIRVAEEAGMRLEVSHLKVSDKRMWTLAPKVLALLEEARSRGVDASGDFYPYTAGSTTTQPLFPRWALAGGDDALLERLKSKETRERIASEMEKDPFYRLGQADLSPVVVARCTFDPSLEGKSIAQITKERSGATSLRAQIETLLDLRLRGELLTILHTNGPDDLLTYAAWPQSAVASDTIYGPVGEGTPHPRNYGTNARVLAEFVRKRPVLTLPDAIRKMTSLPARTFGLRDRGLVREGMAADLVLFDPALVEDRATFEKPHQFSVGFDWVIVNGKPVIEEGKRNGERPGRIVRRTM